VFVLLVPSACLLFVSACFLIESPQFLLFTKQDQVGFQQAVDKLVEWNGVDREQYNEFMQAIGRYNEAKSMQ
jgi:hypothetical protein